MTKSKLGSSRKWVGEIGVSYDREKSSGAPEAQISPLCPKFEPLGKRFFSPAKSEGLVCQATYALSGQSQNST